MESAEQQAGERVRKRAWLDQLDIPARPSNVDEALMALGACGGGKDVLSARRERCNDLIEGRVTHRRLRDQ